MTKLKICGLTRPEDALFAAKAGADFLGFIFFRESVRCVDASHVGRIAEAVRSSGSAAQIVGVFRNASHEEIMRTAVDAKLDLAQLHGHEDDDFIRALPLPVIKTIHVGETRTDIDRFPSAAWLLFDTLHHRLAGGTGKCFDWTLISDLERTTPILLAGGINAANASAAIDFVHPDGIDVASGVESAPGIKDHEKIRDLVEQVKTK